MTRSRKLNVVCIGQVTRDEIYGSPDLPTDSYSNISPETIRIGGKAFNQAVAAARLGGGVRLVSAIGTDWSASEVERTLKRESVKTDCVVWCSDGIRRQVETVVVRLREGPRGERKVVVLQPPVFNECYDTAILRAKSHVLRADIVIVTFELGTRVLNGLWGTLQDLKQSNPNALIVLNPAPATEDPRGVFKGLRLADIVVPNRLEAEALVDQSPTLTGPKVAREIRDTYGTPNVCVTVGARGAFWVSPTNYGTVKARDVKVIDKVGASDVFTSALAIGYWYSRDFETAVKLGNIAAAIAVSRPGGSEAAPTVEEVKAYCDATASRRTDPAVANLVFDLAAGGRRR